MPFPDLVPTARTFESGDYPVKTFKAQNGHETRILYVSNRTKMNLSLTYANLFDADAELFLDHYDEVQGTFQTFDIGDVKFARGGWEGTPSALGPKASGNKYRYENPPQVVQVRPGVSSVTVNLIGAL